MMVRKWWIPALSLALTTLPLATQAEAPGSKPTVASFDWGSVDTLEALGLEEQLVGLPHQSAPSYVAHLLQGRPDVGSLKEPDAGALADIAPDLILVTGRQGDAGLALDGVAEVMDVSLGEGEFLHAFSDRVLRLAERFDAVPRAEAALEELRIYIEEARGSLPQGASVLVVTHSDGNYSLRQEPVVSELLQLSAPTVPKGVETQERGSRTFIPLTPANMVRMNPDAVLVVDRSAAIGQVPLDVDALKRSLADEGGADIVVELLSPGLWYLSGAGLVSVRAQVDEVATALGRH
ncbi:ABC transporter substrate-binding protein [Billgrantia bachuensis]|uniref:ABC transporter substrate-binding protein n=1 Tax=Billgrantia bachuensis TaxID=2717286 RepID=A0ABX0PVT9_9GAMM|nr:ABC transporter substrate-binding protein [Halomonas bachuensis]NIC07064.1 ABC transporter substrate-binding protein [Halomonas bachuensis]